MTVKAKPKAILFDLDGTLIDSAPDLGAAADKMRTDRGLSSLAYELYRPMAGSGARGMLSVAFGMTESHLEYENYKNEFLDNYQQAMTVKTTVFEGVDDLLLTLQQSGLLWGVVTNKHQRFTLPLSRQMALFKTAGAVVSGDTTPHAKPHPAPLWEAARQLGLEPAHCWYVGDDERDIVAGKAAGMVTVAAHYGYLGAEAEVLRWGADFIIHHPLELVNCLAQA
ncbi:MAG: HAD family hydrolase [Limnohabitans sp.]